MRTITRMTTAAGLGLALLLGTAGVATVQDCTPDPSAGVICKGGNTVTITETPEEDTAGISGFLRGSSVLGYAL